MTNILLSEGFTTKAKEAGNFAFLLTDVAIPDGMPRRNNRVVTVQWQFGPWLTA